MSNPIVVGFSGNITRPSKTRAFVDLVVRDIAARHGLSANTFDIEDVGPSLGAARSSRDLDRRAEAILAQILAAEVLVVGSPTYKGSYTGLFKHFFDLLDPSSLRGKPMLINVMATWDMLSGKERPTLATLAKQSGLTIVMVASDRDPNGRCRSRGASRRPRPRARSRRERCSPA